MTADVTGCYTSDTIRLSQWDAPLTSIRPIRRGRVLFRWPAVPHTRTESGGRDGAHHQRQTITDNNHQRFGRHEWFARITTSSQVYHTLARDVIPLQAGASHRCQERTARAVAGIGEATFTVIGCTLTDVNTNGVRHGGTSGQVQTAAGHRG